MDNSVKQYADFKNQCIERFGYSPKELDKIIAKNTPTRVKQDFFGEKCPNCFCSVGDTEWCSVCGQHLLSEDAADFSDFLKDIP